MISIRKFVGHAGAAAGISAALMLAMSMQTGAQSPASQVAPPAHITLSAGCATAIQNLKAALIADLAEDRFEYSEAKFNGAPRENDSDTTEAATFVGLWNAVKTACAPNATSSASSTSPATITRTYTPSSACTAAVQAVKAAWALHPTTRTQWQQLQALVQSARTACGWPTWSFNR